MQLYSIERGEIRDRPLEEITFTKSTTHINASYALGGISLTASIPMQNIRALANNIDEYHHANYRNVMLNSAWRSLYQVRKRSLLQIGTDGLTDYNVSTESVPCYDCGYIFPLENITVDHQKPQTGGVFLAIAKVFRAFGYAEEQSQGQKGRTIGGFVALSAIPIRQSKNGTKKDDRNTLNKEGTAIFSLLYEKQGNILERCCMHSLINLKPLCNSCNSSKGNTIS